MQKKNIINGFIGTVGFLIVAFIAFSIRYGLSWWISTDNEMLIFFPIWAIGAFYIGYSASAYYHRKKVLFYTEEKNVVKATENWKLYKWFMLSKLLISVAKLFAIMTPFYILAYFDGSRILKSSPLLILIFAIIGVFCFVLSKVIQRGRLNF
ncbi:hypothetical protein [Dysgonomonas sp. BGC7]|uniref:hypothetical protein n=1 Tax=Dysgonomonas sp. BGC7 TaxID=1658008 RepID=UPI000681D7A5|nr:hypothetical protein [Dysgonomonas sp. BGC7]MBD8387496.1 hypothetical protein [Dysgonomonas sp. BGC7]